MLFENHFQTQAYVLIFLISLLFGCNRGNPYNAVQVSGTVTLDGKPIQGVTVTFSPVEEDGISAFAFTDGEGKYTMTTGGARHGSGALPGTYRVLLSKTENVHQLPSLEDLDSGRIRKPLSMAEAFKVNHLIPQKYEDPNTSDLEPIAVERGKKNIFNFELKSK